MSRSRMTGVLLALVVGTGAAHAQSVGVAVTASTLGFGVDAAASVSNQVSLRVGTHLFSLTRDFDDTDDNITYTGTLRLRTVHAFLDWFPLSGGFHVSPGVVLHNGNKADLTSTVPAGQVIGIDDGDYASAAADPIRAAALVSFRRVAPALRIGWGNIARGSQRIAVPLELGVVFQGPPRGTLTYAGTGCLAGTASCRNMATDPGVQANVRDAEATLNEDLKLFVLYPVLSFGIGLRF